MIGFQDAFNQSEPQLLNSPFMLLQGSAKDDQDDDDDDEEEDEEADSSQEIDEPEKKKRLEWLFHKFGHGWSKQMCNCVVVHG